MKIGYIRVSDAEQNPARQEEVMKQLGVEKIFIDKISGKNKERKELQAMLAFVREGDTLIVESISRFARNTRDLLELVDILKSKGVQFISKKESMDTETHTGKFMLTVFAAVAELELGYIKDRQLEGIALAKEQGKYKGRQKINFPKNWIQIYNQWKVREVTGTHAMKLLGLKRNTFYKLVKEYEEQRKEDNSHGVQ